MCLFPGWAALRLFRLHPHTAGHSEALARPEPGDGNIEGDFGSLNLRKAAESRPPSLLQASRSYRWHLGHTGFMRLICEKVDSIRGNSVSLNVTNIST